MLIDPAGSLTDNLPTWLSDLFPHDNVILCPNTVMELAIEIARRSAEQGGGPFGAVIADSGHRVLAIGYNRVVATQDSTAHAEICAIRSAQARLQTHDLGAAHLPQLALYTSSSPCIQCFGAIYWSGLKSVYAAATTEDAEAVGFDEGPISPALWQTAQAKRGIHYTPTYGRSEHALTPFAVFKAKGSPLY